MVARRVFLKLKPDSVGEFTDRMEKEVLPLLRAQQGFCDEITFVVSDESKAFAISLWDCREDADTYAREQDAKVEKILAPFVEGDPAVATYDVVNSTFHKIAGSVAR